MANWLFPIAIIVGFVLSVWAGLTIEIVRPAETCPVVDGVHTCTLVLDFWSE